MTGNGTGDGDAEKPEILEIDTGKGRRVAGWLSYVLLFMGVGAILVYVFMQFTGSVKLAVGVVTFMIGYMVIMGWVATRNSETRN
jgi:uncharacterized membrane protein YhhN